MDIFVWFLQKNASALAVVQSQNSLVFIAYFILATSIKRASFMAAFFMSCMLFEMELFDPLSEASLYLLTFATYSYVITCKSLTCIQRMGCGTILILSLTLAYDAYFYGLGGVYGEAETVIYNNIEYLALCSHIIFISTLTPYRRIGNSIGRFVDSILLLSRNSAYFMPI
ncbi:MAG: hypothetical protein COA84_14820 [Robiginitomaculum sp.]|nr:MAG: hypothetical protein COA84_14820 [Robiginitomaculum sp.]